MLAVLGPLGLPELLIILVVVVLIFGVGKLTDVGGALGTSIREFRKAAREPDDPESSAQTQVEAPSEPQPDAKHCTNCGTQISADTKFCAECGTSVQAPVT